MIGLLALIAAVAVIAFCIGVLAGWALAAEHEFREAEGAAKRWRLVRLEDTRARRLEPAPVAPDQRAAGGAAVRDPSPISTHHSVRRRFQGGAHSAGGSALTRIITAAAGHSVFETVAPCFGRDAAGGGGIRPWVCFPSDPESRRRRLFHIEIPERAAVADPQREPSEGVWVPAAAATRCGETKARLTCDSGFASAAAQRRPPQTSAKGVTAGRVPATRFSDCVGRLPLHPDAMRGRRATSRHLRLMGVSSQNFGPAREGGAAFQGVAA